MTILMLMLMDTDTLLFLRADVLLNDFALLKSTSLSALLVRQKQSRRNNKRKERHRAMSLPFLPFS